MPLPPARTWPTMRTWPTVRTWPTRPGRRELADDTDLADRELADDTDLADRELADRELSEAVDVALEPVELGSEADGPDLDDSDESGSATG